MDKASDVIVRNHRGGTADRVSRREFDRIGRQNPGGCGMFEFSLTAVL
jgi:hypothetical protein